MNADKKPLRSSRPPLKLLHCLDVERSLPPHPGPLPSGEGESFSTMVAIVKRSDCNQRGRMVHPLLGERAGVRGTAMSPNPSAHAASTQKLRCARSSRREEALTGFPQKVIGQTTCPVAPASWTAAAFCRYEWEHSFSRLDSLLSLRTGPSGRGLPQSETCRICILPFPILVH